MRWLMTSNTERSGEATFRRCLPRVLCAIGLLLAVRAAAQPMASDGQSWSLDALIETARQRAAKPYTWSPPLPPVLAGWDFADYEKVWFRPEHEVWPRDRKFRAAMHHRGFIHRQQMAIHLVRDGVASPVAFDPAMFYYGDLDHDVNGEVAGLGFAGFRLHHELSGPGSYDEVLSILGASYFRALGRNMHYGTSARGLAIDTGLDREEFPVFRAAWIHEPGPTDQRITVDLLMDSPSVTGAYRMVLSPGGETVVDVHAVLFARKDIRKLCVAPLTSMFFFGEGQPNPHDFRPEAHDADRLIVVSDNLGTLCRPLSNPADAKTRHTVYHINRLDRFGLVQRDRRFDRYEDLDLRYERRPSVWVEPLGDWGPGALELYEFSTPDETVDNINAFWVSYQAMHAGQTREFKYRLRWTTADHPEATLAKVGETFNQPLLDGRVRTAVEFDGPPMPDDNPGYLPKAVTAGRTGHQHAWIRANPVRGGWRVEFERRTEADRGPDAPPIHVWLTDDDGNIVSEKWTSP